MFQRPINSCGQVWYSETNAIDKQHKTHTYQTCTVHVQLSSLLENKKQNRTLQKFNWILKPIAISHDTEPVGTYRNRIIRSLVKGSFDSGIIQ